MRNKRERSVHRSSGNLTLRRDRLDGFLSDWGGDCYKGTERLL